MGWEEAGLYAMYSMAVDKIIANSTPGLLGLEGMYVYLLFVFL